MKNFSLSLAVACAWPVAACAQLQIVPGHAPCRLFGGAPRQIAVLWSNASVHSVSADIQVRLYQANSATAAPFSQARWKRLLVLGGQTVVQSASLEFPAVRAETRFVVQWLGEGIGAFGSTDVWAYPTNLLSELKPLAGNAPIGIFDPQDQLKPLLAQAELESLDLKEAGLDRFQGKLAILGPFSARTELRDGLSAKVKKMAAAGAGVVWLQPPPDRLDLLQPSFYTVPEGKGAVVVAQAEMVTNLAINPGAQLNLIHFARLARRPEPPRLPDSAQRP